MKIDPSSSRSEPGSVPRPNPNWFLVRGAGITMLALVLVWRAPQFAVLGVALMVLAAQEWVRFRRAEERWVQSQTDPEALRPEAATANNVKETLPALLVSRRARQVGAVDWTTARSWLGGAPRLGTTPWPRSEADGRPLPFLAQIDLSEVREKIGPSPLPASGSLAFFVGDKPVIYVPEQPLSTPVSQPPADSPTLEEAGYGGIGIVVWPKDPLGPRLFPFWPVDLCVAPTEVRGRTSSFHAREAFRVLEDEPAPQWWHSAIHLADCLRIATTFGVPNKIRVQRQGVTDPQRLAVAEAFQKGIPTFEQFVAEVAEWTRDRDPWALLGPTDVGRLANFFERASEEFGEYTRFCLPHSLDDLATATLLALATAEDRGFAALPPQVRRLINEKYLLPAGDAHMMFGQVIDVQGGAAEEAECNYLLLRLNHDDMVHWSFGDAGAYHFFISPDDLAKRNWAGARMTFECG
ncbi:MAG: DUF1963 domain-containing protein [Bryobacteraceae bacterium]